MLERATVPSGQLAEHVKLLAIRLKPLAQEEQFSAVPEQSRQEALQLVQARVLVSA